MEREANPAQKQKKQKVNLRLDEKEEEERPMKLLLQGEVPESTEDKLLIRKKIKARKVTQDQKIFLICPRIFISKGLSKMRRKIIAAYSNDNILKLYEIKDKKVASLSTHQIGFPQSVQKTRISWMWQAENKEIIFFKKNQRNSSEDKSNNRDILVLRAGYGEAETKAFHIKAELLATIKQGEGDYDDYRIFRNLNNWHKFNSNKRLCLLKVNYLHGPEKIKLTKLFLARLCKDHKNGFKFISNLTFRFSKLKSYSKKRDIDSQGLTETVRNHLTFSKVPRFNIDNSTSKSGYRYCSFYQFDEQMLTAGAIDLRSKKILSKSFLSVFEIFKAMGYRMLYHCLIMKIDYSIYSFEQDTLYLGLTIFVRYLYQHNRLLMQIYEKEMSKVGVEYDSPRVFLGSSQNSHVKTKVEMMVLNFRDVEKREFSWKEESHSKSSMSVFAGGVMSLSKETKENFVMKFYDGLKNLKKVEELKFKGKGSNTKKSQLAKFGQSCFRIQIPKRQLLKHFGDNLYDFTKIIEVSPELLVAHEAKRIILIDKNEGKIIHWKKYTDNFIPSPSMVKIDQDIVAVLCSRSGVVEIYQIQSQPLREGSFFIRNIGSLNLQRESDIHQINELLGVKKFRETGVVQLCLIVSVYRGECKSDTVRYVLTAHKQIVLEKNFKTKKLAEEERQGELIKELETERENSIESQEKHCRIEEDSWAIEKQKLQVLMLTNNRTRFYLKRNRLIQLNDASGKIEGFVIKTWPILETVSNIRFQAIEKLIGRRRVYDLHYQDSKLYLILGRELSWQFSSARQSAFKEIYLVEVLKDNDKSESNKQNCRFVKSLVLDDSAQVLFYHNCEKARIFAWTKISDTEQNDEEDAESTHRSLLTVYDDQLQKNLEIDLGGFEIKINQKTNFRVLDEDRVFMVAKRSTDGKFLILILNLKEKTLSEVTDGEGQSRDGALLGWTGERLVLVDILGFESKICTSGQVYVSDKI